MATFIHPTALVEPGAQLGPGCQVHAYAVITRWARLAENVVVHAFAVVGGDPQFLKFIPHTASAAEVGADTVVREHVTINRSIHEGGATRVGAGSFLMAASHVGHDCQVGRQVVLANAALLAGHVEVGDHAFLGGGAAVHQYCRIGESVMVAGHASITRDVPPFTLVAGRDLLVGCNLVGLRRRQFAPETIAELKHSYRAVFAGGNPRQLAAERRTRAGLPAEVAQFLDFFAAGRRGFVRPRRGAAPAGGEDPDAA